MADWPRAIVPEDRIKYLIQARQDFKRDVTWTEGEDGYSVLTPDGEYLEILDSDGEYEAVCSLDGHIEFEGIFASRVEARKALTDHIVVKWAVLQAWEDVAT